MKDSWEDGRCWPTVFCQPVVGNKGGKQDRLSPRQKTDRLLFLIRCRLTGWIWISFQPWTEKQVSQKDHFVALGSVDVYSSLVCLHSFHILHILPSKCTAICRPPFSLCSTVEQKKSKKANYKKEPLKCSRWDFHCISIGFYKKASGSIYRFLHCGKGHSANHRNLCKSLQCASFSPITILTQACPLSDYHYN